MGAVSKCLSGHVGAPNTLAMRSRVYRCAIRARGSFGSFVGELGNGDAVAADGAAGAATEATTVAVADGSGAPEAAGAGGASPRPQPTATKINAVAEPIRTQVMIGENARARFDALGYVAGRWRP